MVALGAKLVEQKQVQRTATEASLDATNEISELANTANNVSAAYVRALEWCAQFAGADSSDIVFSLNTDFDIGLATPEDRAQTIKEWQTGAITFGEMRAVLRNSGIATEDDEAAKDRIAEDISFSKNTNNGDGY
jgi:hypothetical protein